MTEAVDSYNSEISVEALSTLKKKLKKKGSHILSKIYTSREVNKIKHEIRKYFSMKKNTFRFINNIFNEIPRIKEILYNKNLVDILAKIDSELKLKSADYYVGTLSSGENYEWLQKPNSSLLIIRIHLDTTNYENGVMQIIPGSQGKTFTKNEIETITENSIPRICDIPNGGVHIYNTENSIPRICDIPNGGVHIYNPMILHSIMKPTTNKKRRVIQLEFIEN